MATIADQNLTELVMESRKLHLNFNVQLKGTLKQRSISKASCKVQERNLKQVKIQLRISRTELSVLFSYFIMLGYYFFLIWTSLLFLYFSYLNKLFPFFVCIIDKCVIFFFLIIYALFVFELYYSYVCHFYWIINVMQLVMWKVTFNMYFMGQPIFLGINTLSYITLLMCGRLNLCGQTYIDVWGMYEPWLAHVYDSLVADVYNALVAKMGEIRGEKIGVLRGGLIGIYGGNNIFTSRGPSVNKVHQILTDKTNTKVETYSN